MRMIIRKLFGAFNNESKGALQSFVLVEFILVILGVLIALQLDNWNHKRQLKQKEEAYLSDIRHSLTIDQGRIDHILDFNQTKDSALSASVALMGTKMDNDTRSGAFLPLLYKIGYFDIFQPEYVAFENMIATESIDLIRDPALRSALSNYYSNRDKYLSGTQERVKEKTRQFLDYVMPVFISNEVAVLTSGQDLEFQYGSASENEFHKDARVFYELLMMKLNVADQNSELEIYSAQIDELLSQIDEQ